MRRVWSIFLISALLLPFSGCRHPASGEADAEEIPPSLPSYDQEWYAFNGRSIVMRDSLYGLIDDGRQEIMPPVYESFEFLNDDIALVSRFGAFMLADRRGRIFAESPQDGTLRTGFQELYEKTLESDMQQWDAFLDQFETWERQCLLLRGKVLSNKDFSALALQQDDLLQQLADLPGAPTLEQRERLGRIITSYRNLAR